MLPIEVDEKKAPRDGITLTCLTTASLLRGTHAPLLGGRTNPALAILHRSFSDLGIIHVCSRSVVSPCTFVLLVSGTHIVNRSEHVDAVSPAQPLAFSGKKQSLRPTYSV
jgi:hypothetical protein